MYIYIITQYGNTVYKKFKFAQKNKPDKAFGDFRCQTSGAYKVRRNAKKRLSPLDYRKGRKTAPVKDKAEFGAMKHP